ncbi:MAG: hypothetical protein NT029_14615 [Armatimonadetes bacterium]|nr:hypothetical protein [Armatimonadota bacterium]
MNSLAVALVVLALTQGAPPPPAATVQPAQPPKLVYAGSSTAFVCADSLFAAVAVLMNSGQMKSAGHRVEFFAANGLEYAGGDTRPSIPELDPGAWHAVRCSMAPTKVDSPLVLGAVSKQDGAIPTYVVQPLHHLETDPGAEAQRVPAAPGGRVRGKRAYVETLNLRVSVETTVAGVPLLLLACRTKSGWRRAGAVAPLASVLSAESGQEPWWEVMKLDEMSVSAAADAAVLTLSGSVGLRWKATATIALRVGRSAADITLRLSPLKSVTCRAVRLAPFCAGDRSFGAAVAESLIPASDARGGVGAVRWGEITTGVAVDPASASMQWSPSFVPVVPGLDYVPITFEWAPTSAASALAAGVRLEFKARLFAMPGTVTVQEAMRHAPATVPSAEPPAAQPTILLPDPDGSTTSSGR